MLCVVVCVFVCLRVVSVRMRVCVFCVVFLFWGVCMCACLVVCASLALCGRYCGTVV